MSILDDLMGEYGFAVPKAAYDKLQEHIAARQPGAEIAVWWGPMREFIADCAANSNYVHVPTVRSDRAIKLLALIDQRDEAPGVE